LVDCAEFGIPMTIPAAAPLRLRELRIGYVPYGDALSLPGDSRRFVYYAKKRGLKFELANPMHEYDVVVLSGRADISVWSRYPKAKLVYDLIDSYLAVPRSDIKGRLRGLFKFISRQSRYLQLDYWKAIGAMCARADAVVCSTHEQRADIMKYCANVHVILDAHMGVARSAKTDYRAHTPFKLVWEGLPHTLGSLTMIQPVIERLSQKYPIELHVITDREHYRYLSQFYKANTLQKLHRIFPKAYFHDWTESNFAHTACECDLAVIPLQLNDPFASGKPENKLLLFWRMGIPVITSATPAYQRAMRNAGLDLAVHDEQGWYAAIEKLLQDEASRHQAGKLGKDYTEQQFSESILLSKWDALFESLGFSVD
jgi:glycosyltransferase involved in cell wall biosynthesis